MLPVLSGAKDTADVVLVLGGEMLAKFTFAHLMPFSNGVSPGLFSVSADLLRMWNALTHSHRSSFMVLSWVELVAPASGALVSAALASVAVASVSLSSGVMGDSDWSCWT